MPVDQWATSMPEPLPSYLRLYIDGQAGAGKTHFLGTVGKGKRILVLDLEGGSVAYSSPAFRNDPASTELENIRVVTFDDITDASELVHRIESRLTRIIQTRNSDEYEVVALDSMTEFQKRFLSLHKAADPRQSYGALSDAAYSIMSLARNTPANVVFTGRPKIARDEVANKDIIRSDVAPSVWSVFSGLIDAIGYFSIRQQGVKVFRSLDFSVGTRFQAKDRYGIGELVNPTMVQLLEVIHSRTESKAAAPAPVVKPKPVFQKMSASVSGGTK